MVKSSAFYFLVDSLTAKDLQFCFNLYTINLGEIYGVN